MTTPIQFYLFSFLFLFFYLHIDQIIHSTKCSNHLHCIKLYQKYTTTYLKKSDLPHVIFFIYRSQNAPQTNCISLRPQNATSKTVLYPNAGATSLFPFTTAPFQVVNQIRFPRCLRHFSCPYYSSPFFALYHRPTAIATTNYRIKKEKYIYNRVAFKEDATKCISIKFHFTCSTLHVASLCIRENIRSQRFLKIIYLDA